MSRKVISFAAHQFSSMKGLSFSAEDYSKLKHGSKTVARKFGVDLATQFLCSPEFLKLMPDIIDKQIVVSSAPWKSVPVASTTLTDYFMSKFNPVWSSNYKAAESLKISRGHSYNDDYGAMSKEQRDNAISADNFYIDKETIKGKVLFLIDDVKITGAHERRMDTLLDNAEFDGTVVYLYFAQFVGEGDPNIENKLNYAFVNNLVDINYIIDNDEFIFNTRVIKYILRAEKSEFQTFINYQSKSFRHSFNTFLTGNEYHKLPEFLDNYLYLKSKLV